MLIGISYADRIHFQSLTQVHQICLNVNALNSRLRYSYSNAHLMITDHEIFGTRLASPIPFCDGFTEFYLPYDLTELVVRNGAFSQTNIQLRSTPNGFSMMVFDCMGDPLSESRAVLEFDRFLSLQSFCLQFGLMTDHMRARGVLMNSLAMELPTVFGYLWSLTVRRRERVTLGSPREYSVNDDHSSEPTQNIGAVQEIANPRDNPTGITKRPHERAGHSRRLPSGEIVYVQPTTVHKEEYVPDGYPKKLNH